MRGRSPQTQEVGEPSAIGKVIFALRAKYGDEQYPEA